MSSIITGPTPVLIDSRRVLRVEKAAPAINYILKSMTGGGVVYYNSYERENFGFKIDINEDGSATVNLESILTTDNYMQKTKVINGIGNIIEKTTSSNGSDGYTKLVVSVNAHVVYTGGEVEATAYIVAIDDDNGAGDKFSLTFYGYGGWERAVKGSIQAHYEKE